MHVNDKTATSL